MYTLGPPGGPPRGGPQGTLNPGAPGGPKYTPYRHKNIYIGAPQGAHFEPSPGGPRTPFLGPPGGAPRPGAPPPGGARPARARGPGPPGGPPRGPPQEAGQPTPSGWVHTCLCGDGSVRMRNPSECIDVQNPTGVRSSPGHLRTRGISCRYARSQVAQGNQRILGGRRSNTLRVGTVPSTFDSLPRSLEDVVDHDLQRDAL